MTPTEERISKIVKLGEAVWFERPQDVEAITEAQLQIAHQRLRSIGREVSRLPSKFKSAYEASVPWQAMSEWGDRRNFSEAEFNLEVLAGCCEILETALPELTRHSGGQASIQEKIVENFDRMASEKTSDLDRYRQASLIHIAVTILLLSVRAMLLEAGWSYTFTEISAYCLLLIPLWMVMKANEKLPVRTVAMPRNAASFYTNAQLYDYSLQGRQLSLLKLESELKAKERQHRLTIWSWRIGWIISVVATISARIWTVY